MAMIYSTLNPGDQPTAEDIAGIKLAAQFPIVFTPDAPELTDEQLAEFEPACSETSVASFTQTNTAQPQLQPARQGLAARLAAASATTSTESFTLVKL